RRWTRMRLRVRFAKLGKVRWTSHRDVARMWERAFRRARLPVAYTGGFSPRPKVSFGLALPTGCESLAEYLDLELASDVDGPVEALAVVGTTAEGAGLEAELGTQPRGVRPGELLTARDPVVELGLVRRTHQWIERDGARWEPVPPQATDAPHAEARAS